MMRKIKPPLCTLCFDAVSYAVTFCLEHTLCTRLFN